MSDLKCLGNCKSQRISKRRTGIEDSGFGWIFREGSMTNSGSFSLSAGRQPRRGFPPGLYKIVKGRT